MSWKDSLPGFDLDNDFIFHEQIEPIAQFQSSVIVDQGQPDLRDNSETLLL